MTELERFKAVVRFERPDYWPLSAAHELTTPARRRPAEREAPLSETKKDMADTARPLFNR